MPCCNAPHNTSLTTNMQHCCRGAHPGSNATEDAAVIACRYAIIALPQVRAGNSKQAAESKDALSLCAECRP